MSKYYEDWTEFAVCRSVGGDDWFPEKGGNVKAPVAVCQGCPVRLLCLEKAMRDELGKHRQFRMGIWGGLTPRARQKRGVFEAVKVRDPHGETSIHAQAERLRASADRIDRHLAEQEAREVAERVRKYLADNSPLMAAARTSI